MMKRVTRTGRPGALPAPLFSLFLLAAALGSAWPAQAVQIEESFSRSFNLPADGVFVLTNINGDIEIDTWEDARAVIDCRKVVNGESEEKAREWLSRVNVEFRQPSAERLEVETNLPESDDWSFFSFLFGNRPSASVDYRVRLPRRAKIEVESVNSSLTIRGAGGSLTAETVNGSIRIADSACPLEASTVNGEMDVELAGLEDFGGREWTVSMSSVNGSLTLKLPPEAAVNLGADTINGSISGDFPLPVSGGLVGKSVETTLNGGGMTVELDTVNGSIRILKKD